jgi:hypothetical protein
MPFAMNNNANQKLLVLLIAMAIHLIWYTSVATFVVPTTAP